MAEPGQTVTKEVAEVRWPAIKTLLHAGRKLCYTAQWDAGESQAWLSQLRLRGLGARCGVRLLSTVHFLALVRLQQHTFASEAEAGLQSLRLTTVPAEGVEPVDSASRDLRPSVQLSSSRQHAGPSPGKADEPLVAFAGRHILELSSLPATFSDAKLEALLHSTAPGAVPPVTR